MIHEGNPFDVVVKYSTNHRDVVLNIALMQGTDWIGGMTAPLPSSTGTLMLSGIATQGGTLKHGEYRIEAYSVRLPLT